MATLENVHTDNSLISTLDQGLFKLETILCLLGGLAVFSLMLFAVFSVGGRHLFNSPLAGYVDWIEQIMPLIAFLGIAYSQRIGGHIRMDILIMRLHGRSLWFVELTSTILILILMIFMLYGSWAHFDRSFDITAPMWSRDSSTDIRLPIWPAKLIVSLSFFVLCLRLILQIWAYTKALISGELEPVAVPLPEDAAAIAAAEAEAVSH